MNHAEFPALVYAAGEFSDIQHVAHQQKHHAAVGIERLRELVLVADGGDDGVDLNLLQQLLRGVFQAAPRVFGILIISILESRRKRKKTDEKLREKLKVLFDRENISRYDVCVSKFHLRFGVRSGARLVLRMLLFSCPRKKREEKRAEHSTPPTESTNYYLS
ncbi:hypothetical protein SDC9_134870 [bioreactor metagenome]|uniref:Uncharacterized protein n=1 Tax=bioreactor metagenome TaxID=1076179 RepID=A0A645DE84_9ZZZZ